MAPADGAGRPRREGILSPGAPIAADLAKMGRWNERSIESPAAPCHAACPRREGAMPDSPISRTADDDVGSIVAGLRQSRDVLHNVRYRGPVRPPPSREAIEETVAQLTMALFPAHYGKLGNGNGAVTPEMIDDFVAGVLEKALPSLSDHLRGTLPFASEGVASDEEVARQAQAITRQFAAGLPLIRGLLVSDLRAAYAGDPAATGYSEILLVYPKAVGEKKPRTAACLSAMEEEQRQLFDQLNLSRYHPV